LSHVVTFGVMFMVALVISGLTSAFAPKPKLRANVSSALQACTL